MYRRLSLLALSLLALLLPFELDRPLMVLGPLGLTNVELALGAALACALLYWWQLGRPVLPVPRSWWAAALLFLVVLFVSAGLAPVFQGNALKAALRTAAGMALALAVVATLHHRQEGSRSGVVWLLAALLSGALLAAVLGLVEVASGSGLSWLVPLRATPTVAGPFLRLAGPFDYANQAAMYLEATLPLHLALLWAAWRAGRRVVALGGAVAFLLVVQAVMLTFSRAGVVTLIVVLGAVALLLWRPRASTGAEGSSEGAPWLLRRSPLSATAPALFALGALLILLLAGANLALSPAFRLRLQSEGDSEWYLARVEAPAELALQAGEAMLVPVTVTNDGPFTWRSTGSTPINVGARWLQVESGLELPDQPRWALAQPVPPGESLTMAVSLHAPQEQGAYLLQWDMVQEEVIWFGMKTGRETVSQVSITGGAVAEARRDSGTPATEEPAVVTQQRLAPIPGRLTLWKIAWELWRTRPLVGVGLDNFRLLYGQALHYERWNTTIHTNNWYIETLVSLGLLGSLPFFFLLALLLFDIRQRLRRPDVTIWHAALAASLLAYLIHGLLDYFLLFNSTGLLFWMLIGLWLTLRPYPDSAGAG